MQLALPILALLLVGGASCFAQVANTGNTSNLALVSKYGGAYFYTSSAGAATAIVIDGANQYHGFPITSVAGALSGWTHKVGARATVSAVADNAGGTILVTTSAPHGFDVGDYVCHTGFTTRTTYQGKYRVLTTPLTTTYTVTRAYETSTDTGFAQRSFSLTAGTGSAGTYLINFSSSIQADANTTDLRLEANKNATDLDNIAAQVLFSTQNRPGVLSASGLVTIADGDTIYVSIKNLTDAGDIKIWLANLVVTRL